MYGLFFFFQAEDGIRDGHVTGVQTCALPICARCWRRGAMGARQPSAGSRQGVICATQAEQARTRTNDDRVVLAPAGRSVTAGDAARRDDRWGAPGECRRWAEAARSQTALRPVEARR